MRTLQVLMPRLLRGKQMTPNSNKHSEMANQSIL